MTPNALLSATRGLPSIIDADAQRKVSAYCCGAACVEEGRSRFFGIWRIGGWGRVVPEGVQNLETCREDFDDLTDRAGSKLFIISRDESGRVRCGELKQVAGRVGSDAGNSKISRVGSSHLTRPDPTREN